MSRLYSLVCVDCNKNSPTIGKNTESYGFFGDEDDLKDVVKFLFDHEEHQLRYVSEHHPLHDQIFEHMLAAHETGAK